MEDSSLHALENSWWPMEETPHTSFPLTSKSFLRNSIQDGLISFQIVHLISLLPSKWRPILILIDLCQLHAYSSSEKFGSQFSFLAKLVVWYDRLRWHIITEAEKERLLPNSSWIPDVVHRFCVRVQLGISHNPAALKNRHQQLKASYTLQEPWSYDLLSWKKTKPFDWLSSTLKKVDSFSQEGDAEELLEGFEKDLVLFGFLEKDGSEIEVSKLSIGGTKRKRGRPRKETEIPLNLSLEDTGRVLRRKHSAEEGDESKSRDGDKSKDGNDFSLSFFEDLASVTPVKAEKPKQTSKATLKSKPKVKLPAKLKKVSSKPLNNTLKGKRKKLDTNLSAVETEGEEEKGEEETVKFSTPVDLQELPRWLRLGRLLMKINASDDEQLKNLEKISNEVKGLTKLDIWKDLASFQESDQIIKISNGWKEKINLIPLAANHTFSEDYPELQEVEKALSGLEIFIENDAIDTWKDFLKNNYIKAFIRRA